MKTKQIQPAAFVPKTPEEFVGPAANSTIRDLDKVIAELQLHRQRLRESHADLT